MNEPHRAPAEEPNQNNATPVAESLQRDFAALIAIFDRQLAHAAARGELSSRISDARSMAERGVRLSDRLLELLRKID